MSKKHKKGGKAQPAPLKIGVLISGSGTNLQAIVDAIAAGKVNAQVVKVLSSRPDAFGLQRAENAGIPVVALNRDVYADASAANARIVQEMKDAGAEYLVMAGYMRMVGSEVLDAYPDRVVNLHPALLPSFVGAHAIRDAFEAGVKVTGVTVHFANAEYDKGPIIAQKAVRVKEGDTLEKYAIEEAREYEAERVDYQTINGVFLAYYYSYEEYDGQMYSVANYLFEEGQYFMKISFWLDGEIAVRQADRILSTLRYTDDRR
jgi:phosphoribosylglycinamide formyltransferase-1